MVHYRVTLETICLKKEGVLEISGNQSLILRERTAFGPRMLGTINAATATVTENPETAFMAALTAAGIAALKTGMEAVTGADYTHIKVENSSAKRLSRQFSEKSEQYAPVGTELWSTNLEDIVFISNSSHKCMRITLRNKADYSFRFSGQGDCHSFHASLLWEQKSRWLKEFDAVLTDKFGNTYPCNMEFYFMDNMRYLRFKRIHTVPLLLSANRIYNVELSSSSGKLSFSTSDNSYTMEFLHETDEINWLKQLRHPLYRALEQAQYVELPLSDLEAILRDHESSGSSIIEIG